MTVAQNTALTGQVRPHATPIFATTRWSVVLAAQSGSPDSQQALEKICHTYWWPLYGFVRRQGYPPEESQDLTQGFFEMLLERKDLDRARKEKGRLRSYLLTSMKNFIAKERRRAMTIKRGGGRPLVPLDELLARESIEVDQLANVSTDRLFERRWALSLLEEALTRLESEYQVAGKQSFFTQLKPLLTDEPDRGSQAEIAKQLNITEQALKQSLYRLRQRYRLLVQEEIAHTVADPRDVEGELRYFINILQT